MRDVHRRRRVKNSLGARPQAREIIRDRSLLAGFVRSASSLPLGSAASVIACSVNGDPRNW